MQNAMEKVSFLTFDDMTMNSNAQAGTDRPGRRNVTLVEHLENRQLLSTVTISSGDNIESAIKKAGKNGEVILRDGEYKGDIEVKTDGVTIRAQNKGKAIIKTSAEHNLIADGGDDVTLKGLVFRGGGGDTNDNSKAAVRTGDGWLVEDCIVEDARGVGIAIFGDDVILRRVTAQDNGRAGIGGSGLDNGRIENCISRDNNDKGDQNGGGGKFTRVDGLVVDGLKSYNNTGVGIWFDYCNINVTVRNSEVYNNKNSYRDNGKLRAGGAGIFFEISGVKVDKVGSTKISKHGKIMIENNKVYKNAEQGIQIWGTQNVTIRDNEVEDNRKAQIMLRAGREKPFETKNVKIEDNTLDGTKEIGIEDKVSYSKSNNG